MLKAHQNEKGRKRVGRGRRLPKRIEREIAKFLGTIGFKQYADLIWNLSQETAENAERPPGRQIEGNIFDLLIEQARHDGAITSIGKNAVLQLPCHTRDLISTCRLSSKRLFQSVTGSSDAIILVDKLCDDRKRDLASLLDDLRRLGARSFHIIVTEQYSAADLDIAPLADSRVSFWLDEYQGSFTYSARLLAMFIFSIGAPKVICLNSVLGIQTIGLYGKALSSSARFFWVLNFVDRSEEQTYQIYNLRKCASLCVVLVCDESYIENVKSSLHWISGLVIHKLRIGQEDNERLNAVFGSDFNDMRSKIDREVVARLLQGGVKSSENNTFSPAPENNSPLFDISVVVLFHREREHVLPALKSLRDMVRQSVSAQLRIEVLLILDRGDSETRLLLADTQDLCGSIHEVDFGDPAQSRNFAAHKCQGRFLTFLDGDDLWSSNWLTASFAAATRDAESANSIWHSDAYMEFFASDCNRSVSSHGLLEHALGQFHFQVNSNDREFVYSDILLESLWTANSFAKKEIFRRFPYRVNDNENQIGIEDWRWNRETLGHGLVHRIVPDTIHLIRVKEEGSLGQLHERHRLLPLLEKGSA